MSKVFVFRIADGEFVRNELNEGRLRQGWGPSKAMLEKENMQQWIEDMCQDDLSEENVNYYRRKYNNLIKMLDIDEESYILIPKTLDYSHFTICKANGRYSFEKPENFSGDDFYHLIPVTGAKTFKYRADERCKIIHGKLGAYRSPVNNVWNQIFIDAVINLYENGVEDDSEKSTEDIVKIITEDMYEKLDIDRFRQLGNNEIEKIVRLIFEKMGYEYICSNSFDREGGDADLILTDKSLAELMDIGVNSDEISRKVYVQIKNKNGKDYKDVDGVNQLIKRANDDVGATKILISTTDEFTEECIRLANMNNVLLIDKIGFLKLVFRYVY